ncbi:hypothetical protein [Argonema antarcticum]|uniref:hypothetical protein n=1 Tax=Argonema antarcticum TaxID=2942763 RepID=UPI002013254B|nr:hypothetical protein [Argonema antarcticum]MCL1475332.1 hypothetical protein [Argonema antarcticum A004/B2]
MTYKPVKPSEKIIQQAKFHPNKWIYEIDGNYPSNQAVPPEAIIGAWKVDFKGNIEGEFIPNPNYKPKND